MKKNIIGIGLMVLIIFSGTAMADTVMYLEPSDITCNQGDEVSDIWVYMDSTEEVTYFQLHLKYSEGEVVDIVNITSSIEGTNPDWILWDSYWKNGSSDIPNIGHNYLFVTATLLSSYVTGEKIEMAKISVKGLNPGEMPLEILTEDEVTMQGDPTEMGDITGTKIPFTRINGSFTCTGPAETFDKTLVPGWNLVSLPLTPDDNGVSTVLNSITGNYDAVKSYNTAINDFEDPTTMNPGTGYFIHMTAEDTWSYEGQAFNSMSESLTTGLNCVGWVNTSTSLPGALSSIDYRYVSRWNANDQEYEVYDVNAPTTGFNDFDVMERGEGYFIAATADGSLIP